MNQSNTTTNTTGKLQSPVARRLLVFMNLVAAAIICIIPFHAFLTVWLSTQTGYYTEIRLWKEMLLGMLFIGSLLILGSRSCKGPKLRDFIRRYPVLIPGFLYTALCVVCGFVGLAYGEVTPKSLAYGLLADTRFIAFFCVTLLLSSYSPWLQKHWPRLFFVPATVVVVFGIMQFVILPPNFLSHFGYGASTIPAVQTVDQKDSYQRIQSTLRGANPLGAYLIIVLSAAGVALAVRGRKLSLYTGLFVLTLLALAFTFSRSAWIGAVLGLAVLSVLSFGTERIARPGIFKLVAVAGVAVIIAAAGTGYLLRNNDVFQNTFLHTDENSLSVQSSNSGHLTATKQGIADIAANPLGEGTGTAGPASVYNNKPARISENYYLQVGQETGVAGLSVFLIFIGLTGLALWRRRAELLPRFMLASLVGISAAAMFGHVWADDTLAYIWWGLTGIALSGYAYNASDSGKKG